MSSIEEMTLKELYAEKEHLKITLNTLFKQENDSQRSITKWRRKRDEIKTKRQEIAKHATKLREERDNLNQQISNLKRLRETAADRSKKLHTELAEARDDERKLKELLGKKELSSRDLKQYLQELEWKQQTESMTADEEVMLIKEIEIVEMLIQERKEPHLKSTEEKELIERQASSLREFHDEAHERLINLVNRAQEAHEKLVPFNEEMSQLYEEEQAAHEEFVRLLQAKEEFEPRIEQIRTDIGKINHLIQRKREEKVIEKQTKIQNAEKERIEELLDRNAQGEQLTVEELEFLFARGIFPPNP